MRTGQYRQLPEDAQEVVASSSRTLLATTAWHLLFSGVTTTLIGVPAGFRLLVDRITIFNNAGGAGTPAFYVSLRDAVGGRALLAPEFFTVPHFGVLAEVSFDADTLLDEAEDAGLWISNPSGVAVVVYGLLHGFIAPVQSWERVQGGRRVGV